MLRLAILHMAFFQRRILGLVPHFLAGRPRSQSSALVLRSIHDFSNEPASLSKLTVAELKDRCRERGLAVGGLKADLIGRLHELGPVPEVPTDTAKAPGTDGDMPLETKAAAQMNFLALSYEEVQSLLKSWGHPQFRAKQVWGWVQDKRATSFDEMLNVPLKLREQLAEHFTLGNIEVAVEQVFWKIDMCTNGVWVNVGDDAGSPMPR